MRMAKILSILVLFAMFASVAGADIVDNTENRYSYTGTIVMAANNDTTRVEAADFGLTHFNFYTFGLFTGRCNVYLTLSDANKTRTDAQFFSSPASDSDDSALLEAITFIQYNAAACSLSYRVK